MLFFFGLGQTRITTTALPSVTCTHCGTPDSLTATVFSRYFHFFWIPVIPIGKFSLTQCGHCKQVLEKKEMPAAYQAPVAAAQSQARLPITNYLALILLGIGVLFIIGVGLFSDKTSTPKSTAAAVSEDDPAATEDPSAIPAVGAVYSMPTDAGRYALIQITKTTADSIHFLVSNSLRTEPTEVFITSALRDSMSIPNPAANRWSTQQWQTIRQYNKKLVRLK
ncbi:zinc-ribbon domain-containing protein [Hymenobacter cellulosivorans]|uniref:Zinc ribbon domain-containing protein n=1 Tax=Hymenobacter cellulosivorans TaxID=2932249 RepID=A0ABY4F5Z9_9BACT|nr:zinc-ribbon domain-containing protein [Hymenobacter cellulosivorans]UOQ51958.1 zinc ribbon domain-containing protein [Hymenobacter cellulosivorans]